MSIKVVYECDGCSNKSAPIVMGRTFLGLHGRTHGFGAYDYTHHKDTAPDGWISYDIIGCCYCPNCAADLYPPEETK